MSLLWLSNSFKESTTQQTSERGDVGIVGTNRKQSPYPPESSDSSPSPRWAVVTSDQEPATPSTPTSATATTTTTTDNSSLEEEDYEEHVFPLTIQSTTTPSQSSIEFSEEEGTEITMSLPHKLDKYGFILNMDSHGDVYETISTRSLHIVETFAETKRTTRRTQKWNATLNAWERRRPKKDKDRLRKGIPDALRGRIWMVLGGGVRNPGLYQTIVQQTSDAMLSKYREQVAESANSSTVVPEGPPSSPLEASSPRTNGTKEKKKGSRQQSNDRKSSNPSISPLPHSDYAYSKEFRTVQDTIERDIHRTFPRHNLFFDEEHAKPDEEAVISAASSLLGGLLCDPELANLVLNLESDLKSTASGATSQAPAHQEAPDGQASLRRVLRAYSYYDREVSYCQGMNFIAGMFLTLMSEEEAFWLLIAVMHEKPCEMRGMFGEGMRETHKVLHVAERLIHLHLPKLARHFDKENIHVTMYATQWLLTQYTSSFKFDLVTRVWDAFLGEGWKIIYRVMLALLQQWQTQLLKMSFEEILTFFRELPDRVEGAAVLDAALRIPLRTRQIVKIEKEWFAKQQQQEQ